MPFVENTELTAFETLIVAKLGECLPELYGDLGHRLTTSKTLTTADVPGASAGTGATLGSIGALRAKCHGLGTAVHWHKAAIAVLPAGSNYGTFAMYNADFFEQLLNAFLVATPNMGSGQLCAEVQLDKIMDYATVCSTVSASTWTDLCT